LGVEHEATGAKAGFREALSKEVKGKPIYVVATKDGLVARTVDATWSRKLVSGAVRGGGMDSRAELLWMVRHGTVEVMDLRARNASATAIVTGVPNVTVTVRPIKRESDAVTIWPSGEGLGPVLTLEWGPSFRIVQSASMDFTSDGTPQDALKAVSLVGSEWLRSVTARKLVPLKAIPISEIATVTVPEEMSECDQDRHCGDAAEFGKTGWKLVVTQFGCGERCQRGCLLLDVKTGRWATPPSSAVWEAPKSGFVTGPCGPYALARDGQHYLFEGQLCRPGETCRQMDGPVLGWLDGTTWAGGPSLLGPE